MLTESRGWRRGGWVSGLTALALGALLVLAGCSGSGDEDQSRCAAETAGSELHQIASRACGDADTVRQLAVDPPHQKPANPREGTKGADESGCVATYKGGKWVRDRTAPLCFLAMKGAGNEGVYLAFDGADGLGKQPAAFLRRDTEGDIEVYFPWVTHDREKQRMLVVLGQLTLKPVNIYIVQPDTSLMTTTGAPAEADDVRRSIEAYRQLFTDPATRP